MENCWTNPKKEQKSSCPPLSQLLQPVFSRWGGSASPVPQEVSRQGGWKGSCWRWVSCCLTNSFPCLLFVSNFVSPALCRRISKVSVKWPLWSLLASEPQTILLEGILPNYAICLGRDLTFSVFFSFLSAVTTPQSAQTCSCMKWEAILVSTNGGWK